MRIAVRTDGNSELGFGHLKRCMNLIKSSFENCEIIFILKDFSKLVPYPILYIENEEDMTKYFQTNKIDLLIVDHYSIDYQLESKMKKYVNKILVIDDIYNRQHNCDILLDQNIYENNPYQELVPKDCQILLGPEYVLLNPKLKELSRYQRTHVRRINICFGGSDSVNLTQRVFNKIKIMRHIDFDIIVGPYYQYFQQLEKEIKNFPNIKLYQNPTGIEELLNKSDLAIGSTGISSYERCYLGIPSIVITLADNQINIANNLEKLSVIDYLGNYDEWDENKLISLINQYCAHSELLINKSKKCLKIVDGKGCEKVRAALS